MPQTYQLFQAKSLLVGHAEQPVLLQKSFGNALHLSSYFIIKLSGVIGGELILFAHGSNVEPESVISVMMIITYIFEQMFCRFEGAMGLHCNREATRQMTKGCE